MFYIIKINALPSHSLLRTTPFYRFNSERMFPRPKKKTHKRNFPNSSAGFAFCPPPVQPRLTFEFSRTHISIRDTQAQQKRAASMGAPPPLSEKKTALKSSFLPRTLKPGSARVGFCTLSFLFKYLQFPSWMMGPVGLHHHGAYQLSSSLPSFFRSWNPARTLKFIMKIISKETQFPAGIFLSNETLVYRTS